jgi:putative iron-dependent peroxidase
MSGATATGGLRATPQPVVAPLTRAAIFLVLTANQGASRSAIRGFCGELPKLLRAVGFREPDGNLSCVFGIGSEAWERFFGPRRPAELHPFREIRAAARHAVSTPPH